MTIAFSSALLLATVYAVCSGGYTWRVVARQKAGLPRIVCALPVILLNLCCPFLFSTDGAYLYGRAICSYVLSMVASQKIIAFCLNRGPLANQERRSCVQFCALYLLHVVAAKNQAKGRAKLKEALRLSCHVVLKAVGMLSSYGLMSPDAHDMSYFNAIVCAWSFYFLLALVADLSSWTALIFFDITSIDGFNYPFLATSLRDFWSRRWNVTTGEVFRSLSYDLVMDGTLVRDKEAPVDKPRVSELRRALAIFAVFAASTATHSFCFLYCYGTVEARWTTFFMLQPVLLIAERWVMDVYHRSVGHPLLPWVSILIVFHVNLLTGQRFFLAPMVDQGTLDNAFDLRDAVLGTASH